MADYLTPTVIQPAIPAADITPLERLLLGHIFQAEPDGDGLYFYADEGPADLIWLDRAPVETALAQSAHAAGGTATTLGDGTTRTGARRRMSRLSSTSAALPGKRSFRTSWRRSPTLRYVTAVSAFTCSKMRPDGFGGMAVLITADGVIGKSTSDIIEDFLRDILEMGEPVAAS